jgi:hypothetical protein
VAREREGVNLHRDDAPARCQAGAAFSVRSGGHAHGRLRLGARFTMKVAKARIAETWTRVKIQVLARVK